MDFRLTSSRILGIMLAFSSSGGIIARADDQQVIELKTKNSGVRAEEGHDTDAATRGYTSHFNLDNRRFQTPPTTSTKFWCRVECQLADGRIRVYTNNDARRVNVDELDIIDVNQRQIQVVRVRFWWKLGWTGHWHSSQWVNASPDHYIVYAFIEWQGDNDFYRPIYFYEEPLSSDFTTNSPSQVGDDADRDNYASQDPGQNREKSVWMNFKHDYGFSGAVRVFIDGPYGNAKPFTIDADDDLHRIRFRDTVKPRTIAAYRLSNGELVTLKPFVPCDCSMLLAEGICNELEGDSDAVHAPNPDAGY